MTHSKIEHFYQNIGEDWFDYADLYSSMANTLPENSLLVEIGSWKGRSAAFLATEIHNLNKKMEFHCVDTWKGSAEHQGMPSIVNNTLYEEFLTNTKPVSHIIKPVRSSSVDAAKLYADESIDFCFIDASHEYEHVKEDIATWLPKVKKTGILAGHDIGWSGVQKAVSELLPNYSRTSFGCWLYKK